MANYLMTSTEQTKLTNVGKSIKDWTTNPVTNGTTAIYLDTTVEQLAEQIIGLVMGIAAGTEITAQIVWVKLDDSSNPKHCMVMLESLSTGVEIHSFRISIDTVDDTRLKIDNVYRTNITATGTSVGASSDIEFFDVILLAE